MKIRCQEGLKALQALQWLLQRRGHVFFDGRQGLPPASGIRGAHCQPEGAARLTQARRAPWPAGAIRPRCCLAALWRAKTQASMSC
jgi:hypothetical protein